MDTLDGFKKKVLIWDFRQPGLPKSEVKVHTHTHLYCSTANACKQNHIWDVQDTEIINGL